ncbi:hypothetical protein [Pectobacterium polaris]|uniref:hypothetical protein n=1 Tax=Pectobacterium polaris TaxID=2042057 RepID=UPI001CF46D8D|nr:hypothetical protein [Pectobacterium polaris]MCA6954208.1 hypothetical protein [Pectobacterium polaris]
MTTNAIAADKPLKIRSVFDINAAYCAIKTNGVLGMDNRDSAFEGRGFGTASTNSLLVLENGENDFTVEIGAVGWFSDKNQTEDERKKFNLKSGCKVELTAFKGNQSKILSSLNVTINESGVPVAATGNLENNKVVNNITVTKTLGPQVKKGHIPTEYFVDNYYPENMELYQFTKKVHLQGLPEWKWTHAVPFTGKPEQMLALKQAYYELWKLFALKDKNAIKSRLDVSLKAWALTTDDSVDEIFNDNDFLQDFGNSGFKMIPINWDDYEVVAYNKNRMVRFINKSDPEQTPLSYYITTETGDEILCTYSPMFSFIDGKFIPVI